MLVLSRKRGERVIVGNEETGIVIVTVEYLGSGQVKLGFEAPPDVPILRGELTEGGDDGNLH